jgi:hypothetical protein
MALSEKNQPLVGVCHDEFQQNLWKALWEEYIYGLK